MATHVKYNDVPEISAKFEDKMDVSMQKETGDVWERWGLLD